MRTKAELRDLIKAERTRAYGLKTKKAKEKAWDRARLLEDELLTLLYADRDAFATHSVKGTVRTFRAGDESFLVETPYGSLWISPTSDELSKSWYSSTCCIEYSVGQTIVIEIEVDVNLERLTLELIPKRVRGGRVNEDQYAELSKRTDLAFFRYPTGGMSGLFASRKEA